MVARETPKTVRKLAVGVGFLSAFCLGLAAFGSLTQPASWQLRSPLLAFFSGYFLAVALMLWGRMESLIRLARVASSERRGEL